MEIEQRSSPNHFTLSRFTPKRAERGSSALRISRVSGNMAGASASNTHSGWPFRVNWSRYRFVTTKWVGWKNWKLWTAYRSSDSISSTSAFITPPRVQWVSTVVVTPSIWLEPSSLYTTVFPAARKMAAIISTVEVLPLEPVTAITSGGNVT
ncbi:hypothetical protein SDC9_204509 [bioreactor metagenome]|uniref:Uncharacterized protein n=1 Tax=bioreactor metagenome TaxID=1076179 RepID=A0A645J041_9ZZZZ